MNQKPSRYKWYLLGLVMLTDILVVAIPSMGMSVLAKEISHDLHLNLVQVGIIWGIGSLPAIATAILGGAIGDQVGPKRILIWGSLLTGLMGAARGLTSDFFSMVMVVLVVGGLTPFVTMNGFKTCGQWFPPHQLGLANGLISMGMALGFLLGALISATVLSPSLGGWRHVLIFYGVIGALLSIPWLFTRTLPSGHPAETQGISMRKAIARVARSSDIWLLSLTLFGVSGCVQGVLGYLPLYLRSIGWEALRADGALSAFHTISMLFVLPFALFSDRLGPRKRLLSIAGLLIVLGVGLLSVARGGMIWAAVLMAGMVRDTFMAIFLTMVIETEGIGPAYSGTAIGFTMAISGIGNFIAPPLGNSVAGWGPSAPFAFWAALAILGLVALSLTKSAPKLPIEIAMAYTAEE